jgi:subtilisin family serine protease
MGADITLNSYGGLYADSQSLQAAIAAAEAAGQLFVTAAGNDYGAACCLAFPLHERQAAASDVSKFASEHAHPSLCTCMAWILHAVLSASTTKCP